MSEPVRIGMIGCADIAVRRMLPAFEADADTEIVAVASRSPEKAERFAERFGGHPVLGYAELLELKEVDAVYIPLPAALHDRWVEAALDAGKHVLAEKPLAMNASRTGYLLDLARDRGLALMENIMFVHHPLHEAVRRLVADGAIGELRSLRAAFTIPALADTDIRYQPELGGGALADVGLYPLRAALHFLGPGLEVVGAQLTRGRGRAVETSGAVLLRTREGITAQITFGLEHAYLSQYQLWGSTGRITVDRAFTPPADFVPVIGLHRGGGREEIRLSPHDQVAATIAAFVTSVRAGAAPAEETLRQARLLDDVREAAA
ncbi:Gfo/Idh/MocA family oxidoreductase [Streptomyces sp. A3M-1-3]|uniref:Gfo/Idh/MocA family protein n=1 Tax=Streptomyces sp. A3M-1-3 TaxID=2962044 RepID=UPI0020B88902|nr:Gfo/Idh/MocA family oxidoreductase [Streptomyces sp. A3M-1-3]MCP3821482.1 Gfo/Idh/MocA family oxidoreductase [Streptomyces sp. A3M-1-3]